MISNATGCLHKKIVKKRSKNSNKQKKRIKNNLTMKYKL